MSHSNEGAGKTTFGVDPLLQQGAVVQVLLLTGHWPHISQVSVLLGLEVGVFGVASTSFGTVQALVGTKISLIKATIIVRYFIASFCLMLGLLRRYSFAVGLVGHKLIRARGLFGNLTIIQGCFGGFGVFGPAVDVC